MRPIHASNDKSSPIVSMWNNCLSRLPFSSSSTRTYSCFLDNFPIHSIIFSSGAVDTRTEELTQTKAKAPTHHSSFPHQGCGVMMKVHLRPFDLTWTALLITNLIIPSTCYHYNLCVGFIDSKGRADLSNSIGNGSQQYHWQSPELSEAASTSKGCFDSAETLANTWTLNYLTYESTDIENSTDNVLFGWFHVKISSPAGMNSLILQPYISSPDNVNYVPGEIVTTRFSMDCRESFDEYGFPKENLAPCFFVSDPSPTVPIAVARVDPKTTMKNIQFNYRTDFPECAMVWDRGNNLEFRFYANRFGRGLDITCPYPAMFTAPQNKIYFENKTYGAYDPEPPRASKVTCTNKVENKKPSWVSSYDVSALDYTNQPSFTNVACNIETDQRFSGRCSRSLNSGWKTGPNLKYQCDADAGKRPSEGYTELVPEFRPGAGSCAGCEGARNVTREKGISANSHIGKIIWGLRTTHGMAMTMTTMSIMPLATILPRYYKETFMDRRYVNVHVWHGMHINASLTGFAGLIGGLVAAVFGRMYFGFSRHPMGYLHWMLGYLSVILFVVALCSSPFRAFAKSSRIIYIFTHFLLGSLARVLWTICLLTSFYIPASPSSKHDVHIHGYTIEFYAVFVIVWLVADIAIHVFLMLDLIRTDRKLKFPKRRTYAITVPIPLLRPYAEKDLPGSGLKKILLIVHSAIGLLCALGLTLAICWNTPEGHFFGRMRYTHKDSGKLNMLMKESLYDE